MKYFFIVANIALIFIYFSLPETVEKFSLIFVFYGWFLFISHLIGSFILISYCAVLGYCISKDLSKDHPFLSNDTLNDFKSSDKVFEKRSRSISGLISRLLLISFCVVLYMMGNEHLALFAAFFLLLYCNMEIACSKRVKLFLKNARK